MLVPAKTPRSWVLASAAVGVATVATAALTLASSGMIGEGARQLTSMAGNGREVIWRSAWSQLERTALFGSGLEHFSALVSWSVADGGLSSTGTGDPHNILLAAALGGGVLGAVLVIVSLCALLTEGVRLAREANRQWGVALLAAMPVAVLGWGLVSWVAPAPMLATCALTGAMFGAARPQRTQGSRSVDDRRSTAAIGLLAGAGALVLALAGLQLIPIEYAYITSQMPGRQPLSAESAAQLYLRSHDPGMAQHALDKLIPEMQQGDPAAVAQGKQILTASERDATWWATLALRGLVVAQAVSASSAITRRSKTRKGGGDCDTAAGVWYAFAALDAERLKDSAAARAFARQALSYPMDDASRAEMERLAAP